MSVHSFRGVLDDLTNSLQQLISLQPVDRSSVVGPSSTFPSSTASSRPLALPVLTDSSGHAVQSASASPQLHPAADSLDGMRSLLDGLQSIAYVVPASSISPSPVSSLPPLFSVSESPDVISPLLAADPDLAVTVHSSDPVSLVASSTQESVSLPPSVEAPRPFRSADARDLLSDTFTSAPSPIAPPPSEQLLLPGDENPVDTLPVSESRPLIESAGESALYKTGRHHYQVHSDTMTDPIDISLARRPWKESRVVGAELHLDELQLLMRGKDGMATVSFSLDGDALSMKE